MKRVLFRLVAIAISGGMLIGQSQRAAKSQSDTPTRAQIEQRYAAGELSKRDTGSTLYILDEPTTGLHFEDIRQLLEVISKLVERGNTAIVIEHNLDVINVTDHIIDIGPEGGEGGGEIVATGTPAEVATCERSYTGAFLREIFNKKR